MLKFLSKYGLPLLLLVVLVAVLGRLLYRPTSEVTLPASDDSLEIVTLLPKDAIRSIDNPTFYDAEEASREYSPDELVLAVNINGEQRAYSTGLLSRHEIVNDTVGGRAIAVTW